MAGKTKTNVRDLKTKAKEFLTLEKLMDNLPIILAVAGGGIALNAFLNLGKKMKPLYNWVKSQNEAELFEFIDTVGDNLQLLDSVMKTFGIEMDSVDLDSIADFLQNIGVAGKYITKFIDILREKLPSVRSGSGGKLSTIPGSYSAKF